MKIEMLCEGEPGWTGEPFGWWAKGHHDASAFCAAAAEEPIDGGTPLPAHVRYEYWRFVPWGPGEHGGRYAFATAGTRGAFEVTVADQYTVTP